MAVRRKPNPNSESQDNYLKAILALGGPEESRVASNALAQRLGVAPASVTNMLQKLAAGLPPLVEYERHRGVLLSAAGKRRALEVVRHHRLLETFLYEVLDYPIEEVHEEAERLEHFISERFEERIEAKLGYPKMDPHGHCIPAMDGRMPKENSIPLTQVAGKGTFVVDNLGHHGVDEVARRGELAGEVFEGIKHLPLHALWLRSPFGLLERGNRMKWSRNSVKSSSDSPRRRDRRSGQESASI
jgi:DtxR family Mn-dependent transcriptional regulator